MRKVTIYIYIAFLMISCSAQSSKPIFVATSHPMYAILSELAGTKAEIYRILPPGASPHTFSPVPSDMYKVNASKALFYTSDILDGWAANLPADNKIEMLDFVPDDYLITFGEMNRDSTDTIVDPHFWTDPLTVKAMLPALVDTLSALDPDNAGTYQANANLFMKRLDLLDKQVSKIINDDQGKAVFLFHPSFNYFLKRYNLILGGVIESSPGKEPTPTYLNSLIKDIEMAGATAIFTEPQLPDKAAKTISQQAVVNIYEVDPVGGTKGKINYSDLILYNAKQFAKAL